MGRAEFLDKNADDIELRRQAWHAAQAQVAGQCWRGILQKLSNVTQEWRYCRLPICQRARGCSDDPEVCLAAKRERCPQPELTPHERARAAAKLKRSLDHERAKRRARGETDALGQLIEQAAQRRLQELRAAARSN